MTDNLSTEQRQRYSRTIMLPGMGKEAQARLLDATVLVIGAGALGSISSMYLCASGIGTLRINDFDTIDISNLQRQLSFTTADIGRHKATALAGRLADINPDVIVEASIQFVTASNIDRLAAGCDVIIEASDNPSTKYLITDAAHRLGIPCVIGGISEYTGQLYTQMPDDNPVSMYRRIFGDKPADDGVMPCRIGGILGPLPGAIASLQAAEAIKIITGQGTPCHDRILIIDTLTMTTATLKVKA